MLLRKVYNFRRLTIILLQGKIRRYGIYMRELKMDGQIQKIIANHLEGNNSGKNLMTCIKPYE